MSALEWQRDGRLRVSGAGKRDFMVMRPRKADCHRTRVSADRPWYWTVWERVTVSHYRKVAEGSAKTEAEAKALAAS